MDEQLRYKRRPRDSQAHAKVPGTSAGEDEMILGAARVIDVA
jgi:hypothetical protein